MPECRPALAVVAEQSAKPTKLRPRAVVFVKAPAILLPLTPLRARRSREFINVRTAHGTARDRRRHR
jgi:hypothetical protein